jgi:hypothetical protein
MQGATMSHHGDSAGPLHDSIRQILGKPLIGATGEHPEGKMAPSDEGGIQFAIGIKDGKVCLDFGTPVAWLGLNPCDALALASSLIENARKAARGTSSILTLNL